MAKNRSRNPVPTWNGVDYPRVPPGRYQAIATRIQGPEWIFAFRRWSQIVEFELLSEPARVCAFFNMGNRPEGPRVGRRSRYFQAWTLANGELPQRDQHMNPSVFLEGQLYEVEVEDCRKDSAELPKSDAEVYSRVTKIISAERHPPALLNRGIRNHESLNQESRITESPNQGINQSRLAVADAREPDW